MIEASSQELLAALDGLIIDSSNIAFSFSGVSINTADIRSGNIFFALQGNHCHGIEFVGRALEKGAAAVVTDQVSSGSLLPQIVVKDGIQALTVLARWWRRRARGVKVVVITGSYAKTTTCQLLGQLLGYVGGVTHTFLNQNNEIGVPLTLLRMSIKDRWAVVEIGARKNGDVAYLADCCAPDVAVITAIGESHWETFVSKEGIFNTKTEILSALGPDGVAVLPNDPAYRKKWEAMATWSHTVWCSYDVKALPGHLEVINPLDWEHAQQLIEFKTKASDMLIRSPYLGAHMVCVFDCVFQVLDALHINPADCVDYIPLLRPVPRRFEPVLLSNVLLIDDAYNASPSSFISAFESLGKIRADYKLVVLGEMFELGEFSHTGHQQVVASLRQHDFDACFGFGQNFFDFQSSFNGGWYNDLGHLEDVLLRLVASLSGRAVVFFKASNAVRFDQLIKQFSKRLSEIE